MIIKIPSKIQTSHWRSHNKNTNELFYCCTDQSIGGRPRQSKFLSKHHDRTPPAAAATKANEEIYVPVYECSLPAKRPRPIESIARGCNIAAKKNPSLCTNCLHRQPQECRLETATVAVKAPSRSRRRSGNIVENHHEIRFIIRTAYQAR
ncbi:hypothetical protein QAD02_014546 [Eretmocerus hayati]|uniref:Uncharacterized protein n=1 Tax=Eretmocerus hayati TaxID=131215 RepID=A0ACC2P593_9HYME|nr:hypothetical protein QAD02_014546 [Eretmocerus hayati]